MINFSIPDTLASNFQPNVILNSETQQLEVKNDTFSDGKFDSALGLDPTTEQLCSADYRRGYRLGLVQKFERLAI